GSISRRIGPRFDVRTLADPLAPRASSSRGRTRRFPVRPLRSHSLPGRDVFELWGSLPRGLREALAAAFVLLALASPARAQTPRSLSFDGVNDYVTFGQATSLGAPVFTVEIRFKRTGTGVTANTGATG